MTRVFVLALAPHLLWAIGYRFVRREEVKTALRLRRVGDLHLSVCAHVQLMAVITRSLITQNENKIESDLLFPDKAISEIKGLYTLLQTQFEDATDYILTRNPHLRMNIRTGMENVFGKVEDCVAEHEIRMVTCVCMPKESYSYVAIIDSIKGLSRELTNFSDKL